MLMRYARESDEAQIKTLWGEAFGTDEPYFSWYFRNIYRPERTLAACDGNTVAASLQLAPYTMMLKKRPLPVCYLVGVVTAPARRGQGVGRALLKYALSELARTACRLALLYTDIPDYYQPLGFSHCYSLRALSFPAVPGGLPAHWQQLDAESDLRGLEQIYRAMCQERDGYIMRSALNWRNFCCDLLTDASAGLWRSPRAYAMTVVEKGRFIVRELGYLDQAALKDALVLVRSLAAQQGYGEVCWNAPQDTPLLRQRGEKTLPYVMARLAGVPERAEAEEITSLTREFLGAPASKLWISEIT